MPLPHPPCPRPLRRRWQGRLGVTAAKRMWRCCVGHWCIRARISRRLHLRGLLRGQRWGGNGGAQVGASPILLRAPPPPHSPTRHGGVVGDPGGARDPVSACDMAGQTSPIGHGAPGSAVEGGAGALPPGYGGGGGHSAGGKGGGQCSCLPGPISPESLRLSARFGRPLSPTAGVTAGAVGEGGLRSPPKVRYYAPGRAVLMGWASGSPAVGAGPAAARTSATPGRLAGGSVADQRAPTRPVGHLTRLQPPPLPLGVPCDSARNSTQLRAVPAGIARIAVSSGWGTRGPVPA